MIRKSDWKTKPLPLKREKLGYEKFFSDADAEKLLNGYKPRDMDDKWFVYSEDGWIYFVRSWTGNHIFGLKLHFTAVGGAKVIESWFNSNPQDFRSLGEKENIRLIDSIIETMFKIES